jgi:hypothetical protein
MQRHQGLGPNVISDMDIQIDSRASSADPKEVTDCYLCYEACLESLHVPISARRSFSIGRGNR